MFSHIETRSTQFSDTIKGKVRRNDRRARIAAKSAFLTDGLTVKAL